MKKKIFILIIFFSLICYFFFKKDVRLLYYKYQEYTELKNSIVWNSEYKLKLKDFDYKPEKEQIDNVCAYVGISSYHNITEKIIHRSKTIFKPEKSFITNTNDSLVFRIAQARFNLCELYRRKMELKIESLNKREIEKTNSDTIIKYEKLYYDFFENRWNEFNSLEIEKAYKGLVELENYLEKELKI